VDGEVGRFEFCTHKVLGGADMAYDTSKDLFPVLGPKEWYRTSGFKEIAFIYGATRDSYRQSSAMINRIRYQEKDGTPSRTLRDNTEREGAKLLEHVEKKSEQILDKHGFSPKGVCDGNKESIPACQTMVKLSEEKVIEAMEACSHGLRFEGNLSVNTVPYEDPNQTVNISIDDVIVKEQKGSRDNSDQEHRRKYVHNTVIHVQYSLMKYVLNGNGTVAMFPIVLAFLLNNDLMGFRIQFFVDGQRTLQDSIIKFFSWYINIGIILDWYHLEKKCKEQLSLGLKGRHIRNEILEKVTHILWYGSVDVAIEYLRNIDKESIKDKDAIERLIGYFERNRSNIPCYAARKYLGLRNSSNLGEKMNDLVVSERQKHNGMSWSKCGSVALASVTALVRNKEHTKWFETQDIDFKLAA
jgi:hypothetical protein